MLTYVFKGDINRSIGGCMLRGDLTYVFKGNINRFIRGPQGSMLRGSLTYVFKGDLKGFIKGSQHKGVTSQHVTESKNFRFYTEEFEENIF